MLALKLLFAAYAICVVVTFIMVRAAIDNKDVRRIFFLVGLVMPIIFLYAAALSPFRQKVMPFDPELGEAEERIETERIKLFGGERTCPSFSDHWKRAYEAYVDRLVRQAAETSEKIAEYSFGALLAGRSR